MRHAHPQPAIPRPRLEFDTRIAAYALALIFLALFAAFSIRKLDTFAAGVLDLDIQGQVIWNLGHGQPFASTVLIENDNHLAEHLAFSLIPLAVLYALLPDPRLLVTVQALALSASSLAIFLYARERLASDARALVVQLAYLAAPVLGIVTLDDFHPVALAVAPLAFGAYLLLRDRTVPGLALLALAVLAEEEAALPVLGLGLLVAWQGRRRLGLGTALAAGLFLLIATQAVMPSFQNRTLGTNRTLSHFVELRSDPSLFAQRLRPDRLWDAFEWLALPYGAAVLAAPASLLAVLPTFAALIMQDEALGTRYRGHWAAVMLPFLGFAAADGVRRLSRIRRGGELALALIVVGSAVTYVAHSPFPGGGRWGEEPDRPPDRQPDLARALALVPPQIPLIVSPSLVAYLNNRPRVYVFPPVLHYAPGAVLDSAKADFYVLDLYDSATQSNLGNRRYTPLRIEPPPVLWSPGHKVLFVMLDFPAPTIPPDSAALFGDWLRLDGYDVTIEGGEPRLILHWRVEDSSPFSYTRGLQVLGEDQRVLFDDERFPLASIVPSKDWRDGQRIIDRIDLPPESLGSRNRPLRFRVAWMPVDRDERDEPLTLENEQEFWESPELPLMGEPRR